MNLREFRAKLGKTKETSSKNLPLSSRDDRIRTCGPYVPNVVLYQTEPHPDKAEKVGFEPTVRCRTTDFESVPL